MNDSDARRDDEIVSAFLDGEATAEERARVENDPRLQARLIELRRVATAVGTPHFFADSPGRDELITRALAAAPATGPSSEAGPSAGASAVVVDLDAARRHRRRLTVLSAAAAVLLLILAVPILGRDDDAPRTDLAGPSIDAASTEDDTETDAGDGSPDPEAVIGDDTVVAAPTLPPQTTTVVGVEPPMSTVDTTELAVVELGSFTTRSEAQVAVTEAIDAALLASDDEAVAELDAPERSVDVGAECDARLRATDDELRTLVYAASFELTDGEHLVLVYDLEATGAVNGAHRIYEVRLPDCTPVSDETI